MLVRKKSGILFICYKGTKAPFLQEIGPVSLQVFFFFFFKLTFLKCLLCVRR